jgi:hypothetical protein
MLTRLATTQLCEFNMQKLAPHESHMKKSLSETAE